MNPDYQRLHKASQSERSFQIKDYQETWLYFWKASYAVFKFKTALLCNVKNAWMRSVSVISEFDHVPQIIFKKISERFSEIPYSTHGRWQEFLSFLSSCALSIKTLGPESVQARVYFNKWGWYGPLESDSFPAVLPCKRTLLELFCSIKHFKKTICVWVSVLWWIPTTMCLSKQRGIIIDWQTVTVSPHLALFCLTRTNT